MPRRAQKQAAAKWAPLKLYAHQSKAVDAFKQGCLRLFLAWHRRAGKDVFALDFARERAHERVGTYWHLFPFHTQARRAIWEGIDARTGERFIDRAFPPIIRDGEPNKTEMSIKLECGSTWQMLGSDNYDRMVGSNPCGIIFSEWALCDPAAWDYIRPILMENKGWAMFITTFRGRNHAYRMFKTVEEADSWYADCRTIKDTERHDGTPIVSEADVQQEIKEGMDPALVQQEFYCNPDAASTGAIYNRGYLRLMELDPLSYQHSNKIIRIAWGMHEEGIAGIAFQGNHIIGVHRFTETNISDASQSVVRRYPHTHIIHHGCSIDPAVFNDLDGAGAVQAVLPDSPHMCNGLVSNVLAQCSATSSARESLADFAMSYAPYRAMLDDTDKSYDALNQALAVMKTAVPIYRHQSQKLDYSQYDRSVI